MTRPAAAIVAVVSVVAIVAVIGGLRLSPDAGTDKLVDDDSPAFAGTERFRDRFGDDAIVILAEGDLRKLMLTGDIGRLLALETCLAGRAPSSGDPSDVCDRIAALGATRVVFGPATFINEAAARSNEAILSQVRSLQDASPAEQERLLRQFLSSGLSPAAVLGGLSIGNPQFVSSIVFDQSKPGAPPKSKFGYLFPSDRSALISIRLHPDVSSDDRREAIELIRTAVGESRFDLNHGTYEISGIPVVAQGLADELGGQIAVLFAIALLVMAVVLTIVFGPPLRLLPLAIAVGAAGFAFGLLSLLGGSLTMASVAVLPVVIGLAVDYAIQLQARFREAAAGGRRPPAAAVFAAVRGGPVIATAALATSVGFLALVLSPIPMVREFAIALVAGIAAALAISLTAGLAALSMAPADGGRRPATGRFKAIRNRVAAGQRRAVRGWNRALAASIRHPGRVLMVAAVLTVTGWVAGSGTKVVTDIRELVPADLPAMQSVDRLQDATGVSQELDVIVSGEVTSPQAIAWMGDFKQRVLAEHGFGPGTPNCLAESVELCPGPALSDLFDLSSGAPLDQGRIDAVLAAVPEYFSQAILSRSEEGDVAALSFLIPVMPLDEQEQLVSSIRAELDPPPGVTAEVVGLPVLTADASAALAGSRYWLAVAGLLAVGFVLLAVYRSPSRALVPLLPIALATGWSALVLEAIDIPLNPMSATLGALVIAVATEFSVILAARYHEERAAGHSVGEALRSTYSRTGTAVLASGITSIAGFGVLAFSRITMLRDFGIVTVVDLSVALAGVMVVLPAALVWAEEGFHPLPRARRFLRPLRSRNADAAT
ncbi:MAG TPA: MMPL family transporter [Solirubrobacterales bacterium]|nr:MMPL family transporter [Solirubrobacterales bacterium]